MKTREVFFWLVLFALAFALRLYAGLEIKYGLSNDETVSYLCAGASQGDFNTLVANNADGSLRAGEIQELYRADSLEFATVSQDMATTDIHPPLYFWLLHFLHWLTGGAATYTGFWLNLALAVLLGSTVFHLSWHALGTKRSALAVTALWSLSPAVLVTVFEARHYDLLALCLLGAHFALLRYATQQKVTSLLALAGWCAAGLLSHYYFAIMMVPALIYSVYKYRLWVKPLPWLLAGGMGVVAFAALFPQFWQFLGNGGLANSTVQAADTTPWVRLQVLAYQSALVLAYLHEARYVVLALGMIIVAVVFILPLTRSQLTTRLQGAPAFWAVSFFGMALLTCGLYLGGIAPAQAAGEQYFSYLWPLMFLITVYVFRPVLRRAVALIPVVALGGWLAFSSFQFIHQSRYLTHLYPPGWQPQLESTQYMVTNLAGRFELPRAVYHLPPQVPVRLCVEQPPTQLAAYPDNVTFLLRGSADELKSWEAGLRSQYNELPWHIAKNDNLMLIQFKSR